jgi:hypothetical protein
MSIATVTATTDELVTALLTWPFTAEEKAAVHIMVQMDLLICRPDIRDEYIHEVDPQGRPGELVFDWQRLGDHEPMIPMSSGERVMVQLALALVGVRPTRLDDLRRVDTRNVEAVLDAVTYAATGRWSR